LAQPAWNSQKGAKAWADISPAHLGRFQPKTTMVIHLESTAASDPWNNKTGAPAERLKP
jgi:hypothetical protein